jgi:general secretion pathway protein F
MAIFRYKAVTASGDPIEGEMEARSRDEVISKLQDGGNIPLDAREAASGGGAGLGSLFKRKAMAGPQLMSFTQQLATLLGAGQPLDRALQILIDLPEDEDARKMVERIRETVRGGASLSTALEQQHGVFSRLYVNMVRAGEVSGSLHGTLKRLAEYLERSRTVRDSVVSAMIYPAILLVMVLGALVLLLTYVVPQFVPLFEDMGAELPFITKLVLAVGNVFQSWWWLMLAAVAAFAVWMQRQLLNPETRVEWDRRLLESRLFGGLVAKLETARLTRTLGTLLGNGVPLLTGLSIARNVLGNLVLVQAVDAASEDVKSGGGLGYGLGKSKRFPRMALQMIAVGEESGELDAMLMRVADTFDMEVKNTVDRLLAALVPALTIFMAVVVAGIMLAILLPILDLSSKIG